MSNFVGKKILVTGATGLIGSHLVKRLLNENAKVVAMGRSEEKMEKVFSQELKSKEFSYVIGNIAEGIPMEVGIVDYIFHAASPISGEEIKSKPVDTISANLDGTKKCLEYLKEQKNGRMIVFSSATVYRNDSIEDIVVTESDTHKADALHMANIPYSESKRMIETLARAYNTQYQVDSVIVRISYVYGYSNPTPNTAFYEFIRQAIEGKDIILNNSGMGRRDNIHVDDVIEGLLLIAEKGFTGEVYNLSSNGEKGNFKAIDEIAEFIATITNVLKNNQNVKVVVRQIEGNRKSGIRLDNIKVKNLGWKIRMSLENGVKDTIEKFMVQIGD